MEHLLPGGRKETPIEIACREMTEGIIRELRAQTRLNVFLLIAACMIPWALAFTVGRL